VGSVQLEEGEVDTMRGLAFRKCIKTCVRKRGPGGRRVCRATLTDAAVWVAGSAARSAHGGDVDTALSDAETERRLPMLK
jgi:hypothetical protein